MEFSMSQCSKLSKSISCQQNTTDRQMQCHIIIHSAISPQTAPLLIIQHPETGLGLQHCSVLPSRPFWFFAWCLDVQPTWSLLGDTRCLWLMGDADKPFFLVCKDDLSGPQVSRDSLITRFSLIFKIEQRTNPQIYFLSNVLLNSLVLFTSVFKIQDRSCLIVSFPLSKFLVLGLLFCLTSLLRYYGNK